MMGKVTDRLDVLITTQDRPEMVSNLLDSLDRQVDVHLRITVVDDDSKVDLQLSSLTRQELRLIRVTPSQGPTPVRINSIYDNSHSAWVVWLDDDMTVPDPSTFAKLQQEIARKSNCAALAIPLCEPIRCPSGTPGFMEKLSKYNRSQVQLCSFLGGSVAINRQLVSELPNRTVYEQLGGEENDLAIRILENGWHIYYADMPPILHWVSPIRDIKKKFHYDARSAILFEYLNVPLRQLGPRLVRRMAGLAAYGIKRVGFLCTLVALWHCLLAIYSSRKDRRPVSATTYRRLQLLLRHGVEES